MDLRLYHFYLLNMCCCIASYLDVDAREDGSFGGCDPCDFSRNGSGST
jgi:hypothetical protein